MAGNRDMDVDVVYNGNKRICSIPKGGKHKEAYHIMSDWRKEGGRTSDNIQHRTTRGLAQTLLGHKMIRESDIQKLCPDIRKIKRNH